MGDVPTGKLQLLDTPSVTANELSYLNYASDLAKAKEKSYTLYTADRAVEDAEDAMNDARRDEGKNSYQYKMDISPLSIKRMRRWPTLKPPS